MSTLYLTEMDDMLDAIAWRQYGYATGAVEAILTANPGLSEEPPMLPGGLTIILPDIAPQPTSPQQTVNLWD